MTDKIHRVVLPDGWPRPSGYSNGILARGTQLFVSGQVGWNAQREFASDDFVEQASQALRNIVRVLEGAGATPQHLVRLTWYVTSRATYRASERELGHAYRSIIGNHYPAMTAVEVSALIEARALVEIEATAVIPDEP